jgi:hypothetical protein
MTHPLTGAERAANAESDAAITAVSTGLCGPCPQCQSDYGMAPRQFYTALKNGQIESEPHFSWSSCDLCGSQYGGDREPIHAIDKETNALLHYGDACIDCICALANGNPWPDEE